MRTEPFRTNHTIGAKWLSRGRCSPAVATGMDGDKNARKVVTMIGMKDNEYPKISGSKVVGGELENLLKDRELYGIRYQSGR